MSHVLGLDLSLAATGAAKIGQDGTVRTWLKTTDPTDTDHDTAARIQGIARWCMTLLTVETALVVLEAPSFGSDHGQAHERAGLWWTVRRGLAIRELAPGKPLPVGRIAPATLKARVAGHGRASKDDMRRAVAKLYPGQGLARVTHDEADAVALAVLGVIRLRWDGHPWIGAHAPDSAGVFEHVDQPHPRSQNEKPPAVPAGHDAGTATGNGLFRSPTQ